MIFAKPPEVSGGLVAACFQFVNKNSYEEEMPEENKNNNRKNMEKLPDTLLSWLSIFSIIYLIASSFFFGFFGMATEMGLSIVAGALGCAFSNLQHFESFKGAGFSGQLRRKVEEQQVRIEQLTSVATALGRPLLGLLIGEGRFGGIKETVKDDMYKELIKELNGIGLSEKDMCRVREVWSWYEAYDEISGILAYNPNDYDSVKREEMDRERKSILNQSTGRLPSVDEAVNYINKWFSETAAYNRRINSISVYKEKIENYNYIQKLIN